MSGGKREGAGRKSARGERKETLSLSVTPTCRAFLDAEVIAHASEGRSLSDLVEDMIRRSAKFKAWNRERQS